MNERCYLCNSERLVLLSDRGRENIPLINKVCSDCGLAQRSPLPGYDEVKSYYLDGSFIDENQDRNYSRLFKKQYDAYSLRASFLKENLSAHNLYPDGNFRMLEIGSHIGTFLSVCNKMFPSAQTTGIEPDRGAAEFSATVSKATVHHMNFEDFYDKNPGEKFDVIVSFAVLEHVYDPLGFMKRIKNIINPGGAVFFEVPNIHSHSTGWPFWYDWYLKEHLFHFSAPTIIRLFAQTGFLVKKTYEKKTLRVFALGSGKIPPELMEIKDDYEKVLQSHELFKKEHRLQQLKSPVRFCKLMLFLLLGHKRAFAATKYLKEKISGI